MSATWRIFADWEPVTGTVRAGTNPDFRNDRQPRSFGLPGSMRLRFAGYETSQALDSRQREREIQCVELRIDVLPCIRHEIHNVVSRVCTRKRLRWRAENHSCEPSLCLTRGIRRLRPVRRPTSPTPGTPNPHGSGTHPRRAERLRSAGADSDAPDHGAGEAAVSHDCRSA